MRAPSALVGVRATTSPLFDDSVFHEPFGALRRTQTCARFPAVAPAAQNHTSLTGSEDCERYPPAPSLLGLPPGAGTPAFGCEATLEK
jgi:hypothetical protein